MLADLMTRCSGQAIDLALDSKDCVDPRYSVERDRRDFFRNFFALAGNGLDIGQLKELAPCMAPTQRRTHRTWTAICQIQIVVAAIDI